MQFITFEQVNNGSYNFFNGTCLGKHSTSFGGFQGNPKSKTSKNKYVPVFRGIPQKQRDNSPYSPPRMGLHGRGLMAKRLNSRCAPRRHRQALNHQLRVRADVLHEAAWTNRTPWAAWVSESEVRIPEPSKFQLKNGFDPHNYGVISLFYG